MSKCEFCTNPADPNYGSGRFCGVRCARSFATSRNKKEIYAKVSKSLTGKGNPQVELRCEFCGESFARSWRKRKQKFCSRSCSMRGNWANANYRHTTVQKHGEIIREQVRNGTHSGWASRNKLSYPEVFFKGLLEKEGFGGKFYINHPVSKKSLGQEGRSCFFLDFYFPALSLDLEIDGKQHEYPDRSAADALRDLLLTEAGYRVYRLKWNSINTDEGKNLMLTKVEELLKVLKATSNN